MLGQRVTIELWGQCVWHRAKMQQQQDRIRLVLVVGFGFGVGCGGACGGVWCFGRTERNLSTSTRAFQYDLFS
jgi:hypothetical protein